MYRCVSDRYDPNGSELYNSVDEFLDMCRAVFSEVPALHFYGGDWYDATGVVLVEAPQTFAGSTVGESIPRSAFEQP